ncbi:MAG TPA: gluconate 2-dehydrogenase subunit 3 family protein [Bryobacteraceae bacterium]|nr:gluconate 2-dehydrogenase subunit 3 family protein [Bryobacteraceae bacterium]
MNIRKPDGRPIEPMRQPGYYPGYSTLSQQKFWDAKTREVVLARVSNVPPIRFFSADQARTMEVICAHIIPQDDRDPAYRIPILPGIDDRLWNKRHDGYRFEDMPDDGEAFRLGLRAIDEIAQHLHGALFVDIGWREQDLILESLHHGKPAAGHEIWQRMNVSRFWLMLVQDCVEVYYAHPWAWDEIGYGGPAYPRAYMRLEGGLPEPWEVDEQRYDWLAPEDTVSDKYELVAGEESHYGSPGQGGTH